MTTRQLYEGLEAAIQNVICAMAIAEDPIDAAMVRGPKGEAASYALINLKKEVDELQNVIEEFYASVGAPNCQAA